MIGGPVRPPAVAGFFYESEPEKLIERIEWSFKHPLGPGRLPSREDSRGKPERLSLGYVVPHAGYVYSGPVAAHSYLLLSEERDPETIILIGPNHTGLGQPVSLAPWKEWKTPLGRIKVDWEMVEFLTNSSEVIMPDYDAHIQEHSLEVQLPFIQYIYRDSSVKILPIVAYDQRPQTALSIAKDILRAVRELNRDFIIMASTDLNHYDPHEVTLRKDQLAIDAMISMDAEKFYKTIVTEQVTVCGPIGVMVLMHLSKQLGGGKPVVLKHATSGDTSGDKTSVVGYLAARFPL